MIAAIPQHPVVRENFVACDVLSQLQHVMDNPRFLLAGECEPLSAGRRVRIYASRRPYVCTFPEDTITPCKWTHAVQMDPQEEKTDGEEVRFHPPAGMRFEKVPDEKRPRRKRGNK